MLTGGDSSNLKPLLFVLVSTLTGWDRTTCAVCRGRWPPSPITYTVNGLFRDTNWGAAAGYLCVVGHAWALAHSTILNTYIHEITVEKSTAQRIGRQGKKDQRPSSNSGPTLYRGVSATSSRSQSRPFVPNHLLVPVTGVLLSSSRLRLPVALTFEPAALSFELWISQPLSQVCTSS